MLENKNIQVRPVKRTLSLRIWFLVITIGLSIAFTLFIPDLYKFLITDEEGVSLILSIKEFYLVRSLVGLCSGIVFSVLGLKLLSINSLVQFIRFFLLTFILLAALLYIAFKGS